MNGEHAPSDADIPYAQSIAYATPDQHPRPGLVTAIGVLSIVLGGLGILYNGMTVLQYSSFLMLSRMTTTTRTVTVVPPAPGAASTTSPSAAFPQPINATTFVAALDAQSGNAMTPAVKAKLTSMLAAPGQTHAPPGTPPAQASASVDGAGNATVVFPNGDVVWVNAAGTQTSVNNFTNTGSMFNINRPVAITAIVLAVASTLLSVYLVVAGVMTVRSSPAGRWMHWVFVWLKIPLSVAVAVVGYYVYRGMFGNLPGSQPGALPMGLAIMMGVMLALAVAYPIGLLFALRARSVSAYYGRVIA